MQLKERYLWYASHIDTLEEDSRKVVEITENVLAGLQSQPTQYLEWANLSSIAEYEVEKAEERLKKILIPQAKALLRDQLLKRGDKASETRLDSDVLTDPAVAECSRQIIDLRFIAKLFNNARQALIYKKEDLVGMNYRQQEELRTYRG